MVESSTSLLVDSAPAANSDSAAVSPTRVNTMLLISSLEHGGAERQVVELANHLDHERFNPCVVSLSTHNPLASCLREQAERLVVIPRRSRTDWRALRKVVDLIKRRDISLVHTFLFDAEIFGRLAARRAGGCAVIASERNSDYKRPWWQNVLLRATRSWFDAMIANSEAGKSLNMRTLGIEAARIHVIRNGVDIFRFSPQSGHSVRRDLQIPPLAPVVAMVASFKKQKRHGDFFAAAQCILQRFPEAYFLCVGEPLRDNYQGSDDYHRQIRDMVSSYGLSGRVLFVGKRDDMPAVYDACDVTVLTSEREGTPNVLLESMACGVPVVATDVSDNTHLVPGGDVGFIVPVGDTIQIAERVCYLLADPNRRKQRGQCAREWIVREFSASHLARKTQAVYRQVLESRGLWPDGVT